MATRFTRDRDADGVAEGGGTAVRERDVAPRGTTRRAATSAADARIRGREEFGGIAWGSTLLGYLSSFGLAALLIALLSAAGAAVGLTEIESTADGASAETIGIGGGIAALLALCLAYFIGGYVAGRMARFDGARQGVGVWLWGIIITVGLAVLALVLGDEYNVLSGLDLPRLPVGDETLTTGGAIALAAILVGTLVAAVAGGKVGEGFHRKVDRHTLDAA
jgi:hypothetical protein